MEVSTISIAPTGSSPPNTSISNKRNAQNSVICDVDIKKAKLEDKLLKKSKKDAIEMEIISKANRMKFENIGKERNTKEGFSMVTSPQRKHFIDEDINLGTKIFAVGDFVEAKRDISPGKNRLRGCGFIKDLVETVNGNMFAAVEYEIDGTTHNNDPIDDLAMKDYHANFSCM